MDIDDLVEKIRNLKNSQENKYYDDLYTKIQNILNDKNYTEEEKAKIRNTGRISTIYVLSSYSDK